MRKPIQKYLRSKQAYTLHKLTNRRFTRNHTYVARIDAKWQAYLANMQGISRLNFVIKYLLTVINVLSKFGYEIPVNSKDAKAMMAAIVQVLTTANTRHPKRLQTDKSKELLNSNFKDLIKCNRI